jgi:hypothetical protein
MTGLTFHIFNGHAKKEPIEGRYLPYISLYIHIIIFLAHFLGLCKGISPQFIWPYMVQYLQFRILEFPLIYWECHDPN